MTTAFNEILNDVTDENWRTILAIWTFNVIFNKDLWNYLNTDFSRVMILLFKSTLTYMKFVALLLWGMNVTWVKVLCRHISGTIHNSPYLVSTKYLGYITMSVLQLACFGTSWLRKVKMKIRLLCITKRCIHEHYEVIVARKAEKNVWITRRLSSEPLYY